MLLFAEMPDKAVLLVEDDLIYAKFIQSAIIRAGLSVNVYHVSTVGAALAYVRGEPPYDDRDVHPMPAIVLLDLNLSHGSGFPVLRWLQENGELKDEKVRVVILSNSGRSEDSVQALQYGALSYLIKSPYPETVTNLLRKFI